MDPSVSLRGDSSQPASAEGAVRPIRFGSTSTNIVEFALDDGPVTMSSASLSIGAPHAIKGGVLYTNVAADTDLKYTVSAGAVKEDLILRTAKSPRQFTFHLSDPRHQLGGVHQQKDGSYQFDGRIDHDVVFGLAAPSAFPAPAPAATGLAPPRDPSSAHLDVATAGDGVDATVSLDVAWLQSKRFPIVLDPTAYFSDNNGALMGWDEYTPDACQGRCHITSAGDLAAETGIDNQGNRSEPGRSFYRFDLSYIPRGSAVSSASFNQYLAYCEATEVGTPPGCTQVMQVDLHSLTQPWDASTPWDTLSAITSTTVSDTLQQQPFTCSWCGWEGWYNLATLTQGWVAGTVPNYGFVAKLQNEAYNIGGPAWSLNGGGSASLHPYLQVTYTPPDNFTNQGGGSPSSLPGRTCSCGKPVDTATGNFWHTFDDLSVPGRGVSLRFRHTYDTSSAKRNGRLGYGWTDNYNMSATTNSSGAVTIMEENGNLLAFTPAGGGAYTPPQGALATLQATASNTYTLTRRDQVKYLFDAASGHLLSETDRNVFKTTLAYDSNGLLTSVTDPAGRALTFTYSGSRISTVNDPLEGVAFYYDSAGNLYAQADVRGKYTTFTYDSAHLMQTMTDPNGGVVQNYYNGNNWIGAQKDALNRVTEFGYNFTSGNGYDEITAVYDPRGYYNMILYANHLQSAITKGWNTPQQAPWSYARDPVTSGITTVVDPNYHISRSAYDASGNVTSHTDGLGRSTTRTYNAFNEVLTEQDPLNVTTTNVYDARGNILSTSRPLTRTGETATTSFSYDPLPPADVFIFGDVTKVTDPLGKVWGYAYDNYGNRVKAIDPLGDTTTYRYDVVGRLIAIVSPRGNVAGANAANFTTTMEYDSAGHLTKETDAAGNVTQYLYDNVGNRTTVIDGRGLRTQTLYDAENEPIQVNRADGTVVKTSYDGAGNAVAQIDGNQQQTTFGYDPLNRKASVTDPLGRSSRYRYDGADNMTSVVDPLGQVSTYAYDQADQLSTITYSDGVTPAVSYTYDADGQRQTMNDGTGGSSYSIDSLHRMYQSSNGAGQVVRYGYDLKGQIQTISYPGSGAPTVTRTYDDAGRLQSVADGLGHTTTFQHNEDAELTSESYPNSATATRSYDNAGGLSSVAHALTANPSSPWLTFTYRRDGDQQIAAATTSGIAGDNHTYGYTNLNQVKTVDSSSYGYDSADNITQLSNGRSQAYDSANEVGGPANYDPRGDRTSEPPSGMPMRLGYDQANRLTAINPTTVLGATGTDGSLYSKQGSEAASNLSGGLIAAPAVVYVPAAGTTPPQPLYIGTRADHRLYVRSATAGWQDLIPSDSFMACADNPGAVVTGTGPYTLTVACMRTDAGLEYWQTAVSPGTLPSVTTSGIDKGGVLSAGPAVGVLNGEVTFVVNGMDHQLYSQTATTSSYSLIVPGTCTGHPAIATIAGVGFVACHGRDDNALHYTTNVGGWSGFKSAGGALIDGVGLAATSTGVAAYVEGTNNQAFHAIINLSGTAVTSFIGDGLSLQYGVAAAGTSGSDYAYAYDGDGLRQSKTARGGATAAYTWDVAEGMPQLLSEQNPQGQTHYVYGPGGVPLEQVSSPTPITRIGTTTAGDSGASSSLVVPLPAGVRPNDQIILATTYAKGPLIARSVMTPSGYTLIGAPVRSSGGDMTSVFRLQAVGGESSVTLAYSGSFAKSAIAAVYRGADPIAPIDMTSTGTAANSRSVSAGSVTTQSAGDEAVVVQGASNTGLLPQTWAAPSGYAEAGQRGDLGSGLAIGIAETALATAGNTGAVTSTLSTSAALTTMLITLKLPPTILYYHHDQLGSTRALTDSSGNVRATYTYDAYGNPIAAPAYTDSPFRFAGQYTDSETGFQYLHARYYDPATAQFISRDPMVMQTRSAYGYVGGNPLNRTDPSGMLDPADMSAQQQQELIDKCSAWDQQGLCARVAFCRDLLECYKAYQESVDVLRGLEGKCSIVALVDRLEAAAAARVAADEAATYADQVNWGVFGAATAAGSGCWRGTGGGYLPARAVFAAGCAVAGAAAKRFSP